MPVDSAGADDAELALALGHDPAAVEEFYRRHVRALTRYIDRRVGDPHLAADLVATTFLAAIESADRYDPGRGAPVAWLYGIAANLLAERRRRAGAESRALNRLGGQRNLPPDDYGRLEERLDARRRSGPVGAVLASLPDGERELLDLVMNESLTVSEAADVLGIRQGAARMRMSRARERMTAYLQRQGHHEVNG